MFGKVSLLAKQGALILALLESRLAQITQNIRI